MVKISYCPNCDKAVRFHFKTKLICRTCKEPYEQVNVPRTKYFLIQLPILLIGFIVICYSIISLSFSPKKVVEPFGWFFFGFALVLFALAFQILDNKQMELIAKEKGNDSFGTSISGTSETTKRMLTKLPKKEPRKTESSRILPMAKTTTKINDIFFEPNKPHTMRPAKQMQNKESKQIKETTQVKLTDILQSKPKKKKARKIRRAI